MPLLTSEQPEISLRDMSPQEIVKKAIEVIDRAGELPAQSAERRAMLNAQCDDALAYVHTSLDSRKKELNKLVKGLQDQSADADRTISDAQKRIVRLRQRRQHTMETPRSSKT